jgi:hypothetical protein
VSLLASGWSSRMCGMSSPLVGQASRSGAAVASMVAAWCHAGLMGRFHSSAASYAGPGLRAHLRPWHLLGLCSSGMLLPHPIDLKRDCI